MGLRITRQKKTPEDLAYEFRKQNDKISRRIRKLISESYVLGYVSDLEYQTNLGFFFGVKSRYQKAPNPAFVNTVEHLYDYLATLLQQQNLQLDIPTLNPPPPHNPHPTVVHNLEAINADIAYVLNSDDDDDDDVLPPPSAPQLPSQPPVDSIGVKPTANEIYNNLINKYPRKKP